MTALLTDNLPLLAGAPNGIQKLRELILELAVRGKLVDLESDLRKLRLGEVGVWGSGGTPAKTNREYYGGDIPWLVIGDLNDGVVSSAATHITRSGLENSSAKVVPVGTILIAMYGSIGKLGVAGLECATNQAIAHCQPNEEVISGGYLFCLLKAIRPSLIKQGQGLAQQNISQKILKSMEVEVPGLKDQARIVAKVDELMALCDCLEARQTDAVSAHARLVQALLDSLTQASDADDFAASWQRLAEHFHSLFTSESSIDLLKQTLLQLAVMGKLVSQDQGDEPASELLKRIAEEKARLVAEGKIKKQKPVSDSPNAGRSFNVPHGWVLTSIGAVTICRDGERIPVSQAEREGREKIYDYYGASGVIDKIDNYLFDKPLLLVGEDGANLINRSTPIAFIARGRFWVNNHAHVLDGVSEQLLRYVELYFNAIDLKPYVTGTAQPKMNQAKMNGIPVLLPPEAEQHRIVAKVDELMALCDQLKAHLTAARQLHERLAGALVEQAVA